MRRLAIIVAVDETGGFAKDGKIPWHHAEDLAHFKKLTMGNPCIMGRRTYQEILERKNEQRDESLISKVKAMISSDGILPGRQSFVVTSDKTFDAPGATVVQRIRIAYDKLGPHNTLQVFILGGERMFIEAFAWNPVVYMTVVPGDYKCNKRFPIQILNKHYKIVSGHNDGDLKFITYQPV